MKNVIVTGANGFIGRYLIRALFDKGYSVTAVVRTSKKNDIEQYCSRVVLCDMSEYTKLNGLLVDEYDCLFHLAWAGSSGVRRTDYNVQLGSVKATADVCEIASNIRCKRFVGVGSITQIMYSGYLNKNDCMPEMSGIYSICKSTAEHLSKVICANYGIEHIWTYCANIYGAGDFTENFIHSIVISYLKGEVPCLTEGKQLADFTYVTDIADALISVAEKGRSNRSYYIGYGRPRPLYEFVKIVNATVNEKLPSGLGMCEFKGISVDYNGLDLEKLYRDTGYMPSVSFEAGIDLVVKWERDNLYS